MSDADKLWCMYIVCRDHIVLSESEATVERIRQHKEEEEGSDEEEMQEWENKRRSAAFARYVPPSRCELVM